MCKYLQNYLTYPVTSPVSVINRKGSNVTQPLTYIIVKCVFQSTSDKVAVLSLSEPAVCIP